MTIPLVILAVCSVIAGYSFVGIKDYYYSANINLLQTTNQLPTDGRYIAPPEIGWVFEMGVPLLAVLGGVAGAYLLYRGRSSDPLHIKVLARKFYFDEFYDRSLVGGQQVTANFFAWIDSWILEGAIIRGMAYLSAGLGEMLKLFQTGSLQAYAFLFSLGGVLLIYFTLFAH